MFRCNAMLQRKSGINILYCFNLTVYCFKQLVKLCAGNCVIFYEFCCIN